MGAEDETGEVRFVHDLPQCCAESRLRLPRPAGVHLMVAGEDGGDDWLLGLDEWTVRVGVTWVGAEEDLVAALEGHHGLGPDVVDPEAVLAAHGVSLEWDGTAEVGHASLYVANLASDLNGACGRAQIRDGGDLMQAADEAASDLETLVEPLIARGDEGETWSADLVDQWPDVEALLSAAILLRSVRVTPCCGATGSALGRRRAGSRCSTRGPAWSRRTPRRWTGETESPGTQTGMATPPPRRIVRGGPSRSGSRRTGHERSGWSR